MKPHERENRRYAAGATNPIELDEEVMFSLLPSPPGKLLDVGCGVGTITKELERRGFDVVGIDFSEVAVQRAQGIGVQAMICDVDADGVPFDAETFNVVWCGDVLEHVFDPIYLLKEVRRVLKDKGVALISVPNDLYIGTRLRFLLGRSPQSNIYRKYGQCKHHTVFSKELLEYMIKSVGLQQTQLIGVCRIPKTSLHFVTHNNTILSLLSRTLIVKVAK